jgi:hypothetical protein
MSVSINVGVSINSKGGDCWKVGLDSWLSLMSTLRTFEIPQSCDRY